MKYDLKLMKHAKEYIQKMANGINPLTGDFVPEEDIINNIRISRCLFYVNDVLGDILINQKNSKTNKKTPFYLTKEEVNKYMYSNENIPISIIVKKINELKKDSDMANLKASDVCKWLVNINLLEELKINNKTIKRPTETGRNMGMYTEHRIARYGNEYDIVLYNKQMQEFIIDNFSNLLDYIYKEV